MFFTGFYSLTFLVGTFLLPDFDRPSSPSAGDGTAPPTDAKYHTPPGIPQDVWGRFAGQFAVKVTVTPPVPRAAARPVGSASLPRGVYE